MWRIDRDYINEKDADFDKVGTEYLGGPFGDAVRFRLKDDDGEIYYGGFLSDDDECRNQDSVLQWGNLDAGCTTIEVKRNGEWVQEIG